MHALDSIIEWIALAVDVVASLVMVWGFVTAVLAFIHASLRTAAAERFKRLQMVRCGLGMKLVFALELMIISDLLHTVVSRSMDDLLFLGALVLIRTVVAYFLNQEIQEVGRELAGES